MDRNNFIGLILMLVLVTVYFQFFSPEPDAPVEIDNVVDSTQVVTENNRTATDTATSTSTQPQVLSDSAQQRLDQMKYGLFSSVASGSENIVTIENDKLLIDLSTKGGAIQTVTLKEYKAYDGSPLMLFDQGHTVNLYFEHLSKRINLNDLYFDHEIKRYEDSTQLVFTMNINGSALEQVYTLRDGEYQLGYQLVDKGVSKQIEAKDLSLFWSAALPKLETDLKDARNRTAVHFYTNDDGADELSRTSQDHEEETVEEPVKWVSFNQKFFSSAIIAENSFKSGFFTQDVPANENVTKQTTMQVAIPYTDFANGKTNYEYYFGPNKNEILSEVTEGFSDNVNLGWFFLPWINKYLIIPIWNFLELFIGNYGVIIIVMVVIIRIILSPLTYRSHISMAKMRVLKPEIDAIKEETGEDMQKFQQEQMALYRKVGINPLSGCIPVLLQFPILVSLFFFIPSAIELRQVSFLWADDLSTYDSILNLPFEIPFYGDHVSLFTLLMAGSTVLYTIANSQMTTVQGPMKTVQYVMPVMLLFFFNSYPSGLSYYYFISNIVSYGQIALFRKFINEDKIKRILEENKKKNANKKKSKFQLRLEEAMKASQEAQKKKGGQNKKKKK